MTPGDRGPKTTGPTGIACLRTYRLGCPLPEPFAFSQWRYERRHGLLVRITARDGIDGWGECYGPAVVTQAAITSFYAPLLIGLDSERTDAIWHHLWQVSLDFARRGVMMGAMSGIDMALWDLCAKRAGISVAEKMGGRHRDSVRCYATGMYFRDMEEDELVDALVAEALEYYRAGFGALKIKVGKNTAFDERLAGAMRAALPEAVLAADSNHAYDLPEARRIGGVLSELDYAWFEEPLSPEAPEQFRQLHDLVTVPLATGECEQTRFGFRTLLSSGGVDIAQPDLAYCGGPSEAMKVRALASSMNVAVVPHAWGTMFNMAAALHFLASAFRHPGRAEQAEGMLECDRTDNPLRDEMFSTPLVIESGVARVPTSPGLGVELDLAAMRKFCECEEEIHE